VVFALRARWIAPIGKRGFGMSVGLGQIAMVYRALLRLTTPSPEAMASAVE
jgi:hypothetical protein